LHKEIPKILNETLEKHYDARHMHHIECLIDGIVKTRCMLDGDMSFKAIEKDYEDLKIVWTKLISSWFDLKEIRYMDINQRIFYMPENSQYIYWEIVKLKRPVEKIEAQTIALKSMGKGDFYEAWISLIDNGLLQESDGVVKPHFMGEITDGPKQERL